MDMDFILIFNVVTSAIPGASGENACRGRPSLNSQSALVFLYSLFWVRRSILSHTSGFQNFVAIEGLQTVLL